MKQLLIVGARGLGREVFHLAHDCKGYNTEFVIKGFLDDNKMALDGFEGYAPIIDSVENYVPGEEDVFICALGSVQHKKKYAGMILEKGGKFINLIHNSIRILPNVKLGVGVTIDALCGISVDVKIGDFVTMGSHTILGHDVEVGSWSHIGSQCFVGGFSKLAECATVNVGSLLTDRIKIGENAVVGIGSVVIRNVKPNVTVFGSPARVI